MLRNSSVVDSFQNAAGIDGMPTIYSSFCRSCSTDCAYSCPGSVRQGTTTALKSTEGEFNACQIPFHSASYSDQPWPSPSLSSCNLRSNPCQGTDSRKFDSYQKVPDEGNTGEARPLGYNNPSGPFNQLSYLPNPDDFFSSAFHSEQNLSSPLVDVPDTRLCPLFSSCNKLLSFDIHAQQGSIPHADENRVFDHTGDLPSPCSDDLNSIDICNVLNDNDVDNEDDNNSDVGSDIIVEDSDSQSEISIDVGPYVYDKEPSESLKCVVCSTPTNQSSERNFVPVNTSYPVTFESQTPVLMKLVEIIPLDMQGLVQFENSLICRRCLNLIDTAESLELRLRNVKKTLCGFLSKASDNRILFESLTEVPHSRGNDILDQAINETLTRINKGPYGISKKMFPSQPEVVPSAPKTVEQPCLKEVETKRISNLHSPATLTASNVTSAITVQGDTPTTPDKPQLTFCCELCGRTFSLKLSLKKHLERHQGIKYQCEKCGRTYCQKHRLQRHLLKHDTSDSHSCSICHKLFLKFSNLQSHMKAHDLSQKGSTCSKCKFKASCEEELESHVCHVCSLCTKHFPDEAASVGHNCQKIKKHECSVCFKCFQYPSDLMAHMTVHSDVKKFKCGKCERAYKNQSHLTHHMKAHNGGAFKKKNPEKAQRGKTSCPKQTVVCPICDKTISYSLKVHLRTHSNEKLFKCQLCSTKFTFKNSLLKHIRNQHP